MKPSMELLPAAKATLHRREGPLDARNLHVLHEVRKGKPLAAPDATHDYRTMNRSSQLRDSNGQCTERLQAHREIQIFCYL